VFSITNTVERLVERFLDQRDKEIELKRKEVVVRTAEALNRSGQPTAGRRLLDREL
jgi:hypothetical protein